MTYIVPAHTVQTFGDMVVFPLIINSPVNCLIDRRNFQPVQDMRQSYTAITASDVRTRGTALSTVCSWSPDLHSVVAKRVLGLAADASRPTEDKSKTQQPPPIDRYHQTSGNV